MSEVFDAYGAYYDLLYRDKPYALESKYVSRLIREHAPSATNILELGIGTGGHAEYLAQEGFTVCGIDQSESMLELASLRRSRLSDEIVRRIHFKRADARSFRAGSDFPVDTFHVLLSLFHVFSYQTSNSDLIAVFDTAAQHLRPGGILLFDFWYGPAVLTQTPTRRTRVLEDEMVSVKRIAQPDIDLEANCVHVHYTLHVTDKRTGLSQEISETHDMRYLFFPEIELIASGNFRIQKRLEWMTDSAPGRDSWSALCIMERLP